jgi:putative membrane protein
VSYDKRVEPLILLGLALVALIASGIGPYDRATWYLEVAPVVIGGAVLIATYRRFPLTPLLYRLIFLHALVLILGGHYTYARVPVGFWVQDLFDLARNDSASGWRVAVLPRGLRVSGVQRHL